MKVVKLYVKVGRFKEASVECIKRKNVRCFINNIIEAHKNKKFGGNLALWDFFQDVSRNILRSNQGHRYSESKKTIFETIKLL